MPVYELEDGTLRMPFHNTKNGLMLFVTESEITKGLSDVKALMAARLPFTHAKQEISEYVSKRRTFSVIGKNNEQIQN